MNAVTTAIFNVLLKIATTLDSLIETIQNLDARLRVLETQRKEDTK